MLRSPTSWNERRWRTELRRLTPIIRAKLICKPPSDGFMKEKSTKTNQDLKQEAMALYALAVWNGPIEGIHADDRISDAEMKAINKNAVNHLYWLLMLKEHDPSQYKRKIEF